MRLGEPGSYIAMCCTVLCCVLHLLSVTGRCWKALACVGSGREAFHLETIAFPVHWEFVEGNCSAAFHHCVYDCLHV